MTMPEPQPTPQSPPLHGPQPAPQPAPPAATPPSPLPAPQSAPQPHTSQQVTSGKDTPVKGETTQRDPRLADSVRDAYILLDFSCRRGDEVSTEISATLIDSHRKLINGTPFSTQEEAAFWNAFSHITERIKPVTVESILLTSRAQFNEGGSGKPGYVAALFNRSGGTNHILRGYLVSAIITLLLLLGLQMEWATGTFIYNDAYKVRNYLIEAERDLLVAQQESENVKGTPAAQDAELKLAEAKVLVELDQSWNEVSYVRLWWWNRGTARFIPPFDLIINDFTEGGAKRIEGESGVTLDAIAKQRLEYTRTELTLQVLSNYLLVTLFALMGALTQALRSLSQKIQDVSLTENDLYRVRTRVILGVISGVCMALLYIISTATDGQGGSHAPLNAISFLGAFTPWAIAFISGYSVEIFFTLLERVISIVTSKIQALDVSTTTPPDKTSRRQPNAEKTMDDEKKPASATTPTPPMPAPAPAQNPGS